MTCTDFGVAFHIYFSAEMHDKFSWISCDLRRCVDLQVTIEDLMAGLEESSGRQAADGLAQGAPAAISGPWTQALLGDGDEEADAAMLDAIAPRPASADPGSGPHHVVKALMEPISPAFFVWLLYIRFVHFLSKAVPPLFA